jgi:hypothetical protein
MKLDKNAAAASKRAATIASRPPGTHAGAKRSRYGSGFDEDGGELDGTGDSYGGNDHVCDCGESAAVDCAYDMCYHCCKEQGRHNGCLRHGF